MQAFNEGIILADNIFLSKEKNSKKNKQKDFLVLKK
jgi:hypothetical protein